MPYRVQFDHVSKKYTLGLTRTSLPSVISRRVKRQIRRESAANFDSQVLWALSDVSFELEPGKSLALVGRNGAGKTTILKLLANITKPTSGRVTKHGQLSALIELGAGFHPDLTGRENVFLNGAILGLRREELVRRFDEIVAFSDLERFIDTPVKRYSAGMIVRLGFAVAACIEPEILLVDEVLAVGDAAFQQKCLKRIETLVHNGTSIIFVSHNFYLVRATCEAALYLEQGRVVEYGKTMDVVSTYERALHQERAQKLEKTEHTSGGSDIEITKIEVLDADGKAAPTLPSNQPAQVRIHYNAYRDIGTVSASAHITRSDGLTCCEMRTSLDNIQFDLKRGPGVVSVTLEPLQLITGSYTVEGGFLNASDSMGIVVGQSDWFYVRGDGLSYEERNGVFRPRTRWEHHHNGNGTGGSGHYAGGSASNN